MRTVGSLVIWVGLGLALIALLITVLNAFSDISGSGPTGVIVVGLVVALIGWLIQVMADVQKKARD